MLALRLAILAALLLSCQRRAPAREDPKGPTPRADLPPADLGECASDADCVLFPVLSCCGECPPAPPFEAVTRAELDAALIEDEQQCAVEDHDCKQHRCEVLPAGCAPRAVCIDTRCAAVAPGC